MATMDGCAAMALRPSEARKQGPSSDEDPCAAPADPDADVTEEAALPKVEVHVAYQDGSPEVRGVTTRSHCFRFDVLKVPAVQ